MTNELYRIDSYQQEANSITCTISYNSGNEIFQGHFPGNPIVPGVCTMQMVMDLLQRAVARKLRLLHAPGVKYLQLVTPALQPVMNIGWTVTGDNYTANATLKDGARMLFKMSAVYSVCE